MKIEKNELRRLAELAKLSERDIYEFESELCDMAQAMSRLADAAPDLSEDATDAEGIREDICKPFFSERLFENAPCFENGYVLTEKVKGI